MPRKIILVAAAIIAAVIAVGAVYVVLTTLNSNSPLGSEPEPTPSLTPPPTTPPPQEAPIQETVRDQTAEYITTNHPEAAQLSSTWTWTGGRQETGLLGAEKYLYTSEHWTVEIDNPVIPDPIYTVSVNFTEGNVTIYWQGTYKQGVITETSYTTGNVPQAASTQEQARDDSLAYIAANHPELAQLIQNLTWTGGREDTGGMVGAETYVYATPRGPLGGSGWTVTLNYPVVPNPIYTVTAEYMQSGVREPYNVTWEGTWQNGTVAETNFNSNVPSTEEQIRNQVMVYLENNHAETAQLIQNLTWTGGREETGLLGSEKYTYTSGGWNVTMTHPVVPNPIYQVNATYTGPTQQPVSINWQGTWQNGTITETSYTFNKP